MSALEHDFDVVVRELEAPLQRYLARQVGPGALVDDLLQETWLRVHQGLGGFDGRSQLKTWVFAIASHVVADHLRRPASRVRITDLDDTVEPVSADVALDDGIAIDEMNSCVREVIDSLPPDYRTALILHDLEGMTAGETAQVSGCSVATAKIRIHRARQRLKAALARACDFYRDADAAFRCARAHPDADPARKALG